ncbi:alanyl-tRNA synthetase [Chitinophaga caeni]|uniref:Alanyl-tRNA synthetase n=1 Tax=Chitinophaga caeni TaxID=2029983 RepID=A0A291QXK1_9BACT|nr:alanyl-tRNA synthetase [Chitinophaga caeni]ATL48657.1 alanyl-tRNA synthetase [Chitinophaga caeni]
MESTLTRKQKIIKWVKRLGFWGFIFFLVKGLVWLALIYWLAK